VNFNDFRVVSVIFGAAVYLFLLVFVPLKTNFVLKKAGEIVIPIKKKENFSANSYNDFFCAFDFFDLAQRFGNFYRYCCLSCC
jgi:hypothetical protein